MWVYLNLYESDLGRVRLGQTISFVPDGLAGRDFTGQIDWINPAVDPRTRITQVPPKSPTPTDCSGQTCMGTEKSSSSRRTKVW